MGKWPEWGEAPSACLDAVEVHVCGRTVTGQGVADLKERRRLPIAEETTQQGVSTRGEIEGEGFTDLDLGTIDSTDQGHQAVGRSDDFADVTLAQHLGQRRQPQRTGRGEI